MYERHVSIGYGRYSTHDSNTCTPYQLYNVNVISREGLVQGSLPVTVLRATIGSTLEEMLYHEDLVLTCSKVKGGPAFAVGGICS
jgi:hypothetical protein